MENDNYTRKSLSYSKGITSSPSDLLSGDDELTESVGIISKNGALMPVQEPILVNAFPENEHLLFVHKSADYCYYVTFVKTTRTLSFYPYDDKTNALGEGQSFTIDSDTILNVSSLNNFCIVITDTKRLYFLFKKSGYVMLGDLPALEMRFTLSLDGDTLNLLTKKSEAAELYGFTKETGHYFAIYNDRDSDDPWTLKECYGNNNSNFTATTTPDASAFSRFSPLAFKDDTEDDIKNACVGHISSIINLTREKKRFLFPFFVRFAFRLFDGTYARISNPIALYPSVSRNGYMRAVYWDRKKKEFVFGNTEGTYLYAFDALKYLLRFNVPSKIDWDVWSDIIKDIVVFASDDVKPFDIDGEYIYYGIPMKSHGFKVSDIIGREDNVLFTKGTHTTDWSFRGEKTYAQPIFVPAKYKTEQEIIDEMLTKTQFYKLFSVDIEKLKKFGNILFDAPIKDGVLENLTVQEQLPNDDYYGWTNLVVKKAFLYNKRFNMFNALRYPYKGFNYFSDGSCMTGVKASKYIYYVHIVTETMDAWVMSDVNNFANPYIANSWFFYPDTNATELIIYNTETEEAQSIQLKKHPYLNGAYAFNHLPVSINFGAGNADDPSDDTTVSLPTVDPTAHETLDSQVFTSVVNNPFVFQASGDNTVGTGTILGIAANTEAVSQGQFGQYPLIVFTTEGIYGLSVNSEGLYSASYPISREVCNNAESITPTDKVVFFTSVKGLMAVSGGSVVCVSEQLRGRNPERFNILGDGSFLSFTKDCRIAFDYRDSLLRIYSTEYNYHYIYSIADHSFGKANNHNEPVRSVVNDYPDNLIQETNGSVYSLLAKPDINEDTKLYSGLFVTRPLKLGSSITPKSLGEMVHLVDSDEGSITVRIYASNDCRGWHELSSLHGKPWKYYTLRYDFSNFKAYDSFAGTIISFQARFTNRIR